MQYTRPDVVDLGDAARVIQGEKIHALDPPNIVPGDQELANED
jgi:hypothetical protein